MSSVLLRFRELRLEGVMGPLAWIVDCRKFWLAILYDWGNSVVWRLG